MQKRKPIGIKLVEEGEERLLFYTYKDGEVVREVVTRKKATRKSIRPHRRIGVDRTRKKQFSSDEAVMNSAPPHSITLSFSDVCFRE